MHFNPIQSFFANIFRITVKNVIFVLFRLFFGHTKGVFPASEPKFRIKRKRIYNPVFKASSVNICAAGGIINYSEFSVDCFAA